MRRNLNEERDPYSADGPESSRSLLTETLDLLGRRIGGALVLAGALVGIGLYTGGGGGDEAPKYQAFAADGEVFRVNTENGTIIACNATRCMRILARGQELAEVRSAASIASSVPSQVSRAACASIARAALQRAT